MDLKLDPVHGLNPSIEQCFYCLGDKGVVLFGKLTKEAQEAMGREDDPTEAPSKVCLNREPCAECEEAMKIGVILISVRDGENDPANPYRTGGWVVLKEEAIRRIVSSPEARDSALRARFAFVPDEAWDMLQLPRPS